MNSLRLAKQTTATIALLAVSACATTSGTPDRTPKWMRYEVLGSRILRRAGASGQPDSASYVMDVHPHDLTRLPAAAVTRRRR